MSLSVNACPDFVYLLLYIGYSNFASIRPIGLVFNAPCKCATRPGSSNHQHSRDTNRYDSGERFDYFVGAGNDNESVG